MMFFDLDGFKGYNDTFGHPAGDALLARLGAKLATVPGAGGRAYRLGGDEFCLIATVADGEAEPLIDRACAALTERGEGFEIETSFGAIMLPDEATEANHALQLADERLYAQKYSRRGESDRTMAALLEALSVREPELEAQVAGVGSLAGDVGRMLGLRRDELEELDRAAQLHDLGKLAVPDEILSKPGPLDDREWAFVRQHTIVGERILRASPALRSVATVVRASHENWDGSGYPDGLSGEEIPLASRIIRACNAFVAMTSTAPYREAMPRRRSAQRAHALRRHRLRSDRRARPRRPRARRARGRASRVALLLPRAYSTVFAVRIAISWPRSSVDRAADFESAGGGSTPPGATLVFMQFCVARLSPNSRWGHSGGHKRTCGTTLRA